MDKIKTVKIKNPDGSISEETYTISIDARNVDMDNGKDLQDTVGIINVDTDGSISEQLSNLNEDTTNLNIDIKKKAYFFNTVADMKNASLKNGDYVYTLGFHEINDGGASSYQIIRDTDITFIDEKSIIKINNSNLVAILNIDKDSVVPEQFGAYGDNSHDDVEAIQACIDYAVAHHYEINLLRKTYKVNSSIILRNNNPNINGNNGKIYSDYTGRIITMASGTRLLDCTIQNLTIQGNDSTNGDNVGLYFIGYHSLFKNINVSHCAIGIKSDTAGFSANLVGNFFEDIQIRYCNTYSMYISGNNKSTDYYISNCVFGGNVSQCHLYCGSAIGYKINNIHVWGDCPVAFRFSDTGRTFISGVYLEGYNNTAFSFHLARDLEISNFTIKTTNSNTTVFNIPQSAANYPKSVSMSNIYIDNGNELENITLFSGDNMAPVNVNLSNFVVMGTSKYIYKQSTNTSLSIKDNTFKIFANTSIDFTKYPTLLSFLTSREIVFPNSRAVISGYRYQGYFSDMPTMSEGQFTLTIDYGQNVTYSSFELFNHSANVKNLWKGYYDGTEIKWIKIQYQ